MAYAFREWPPIRIFTSSAVFAFKALFSWLRPSMWVVQALLLPLFQIAFFVTLARFVYANQPASVQTSYVAFIAVGNAMQISAFSSIFAVCNITSEEKWQGTLIPIITTPANRFPLFLGRALFQVFNGTVTVAVGFVYAEFIFGVNMGATNFLSLAVVILLTSFAMTGFGLMLGSLGLYMRTAMIIANVFLFIGLLLCGVNFPVTELPGWLQPVSYAIPMTYGTAAARAAVAGASLADLAPTLLEEVAAGIGSILVGYGLFRLFEYLARKRGRLEEF